MSELFVNACMFGCGFISGAVAGMMFLKWAMQPIVKTPDKNCRHCQGNGFIWDSTSGLTMSCPRCMK